MVLCYSVCWNRVKTDLRYYTFSDLSIVDVEISLNISWSRHSAIVLNNSLTTVSGVSGSGTSYTASLSFSPIAISDSGQSTAIVTVRPATTSYIIQSVTATETESPDNTISQWFQW